MSRKLELSRKNKNFVVFLFGLLIILCCLYTIEHINGLIEADLPLRVDVGTFSIGILLFVFFLGITIFLIKRKPKSINFILSIFLGPIFGCLLLSLISIKSGSGPLITSVQIPSDLNGDYNTRVVLPVIFNNGSRYLSHLEKMKILEYVKLFDDCTSEIILVRGFASSRPYKEYSNHRNMLLANNRASFVANFLRIETGKNFQPFLWESYPDMKSARRLIDTDSNEGLVPTFEKLNRRVELIWDDQACLQVFNLKSDFKAKG